MGLWTELGKALGDLALINFKAEENLPDNNFYKNRIQKLEKDGAAIHARVNKIDEARSRVPPRNATPTELYMRVNNVTREIQLFRGSVTALEQHMDIDIRVKQEQERVMRGSVNGREVDLGQEPTQVLATGGNVLETRRGSNAQRMLQSPASSISTEATPSPAGQAGGLLRNDHISTGIFVTPTNSRNRSPYVNNPGSASVISPATPSTVFGSLASSPCLCNSCSLKFGSPASTRNNVLSSPELGTPSSSSYSAHSVCEHCGAHHSPHNENESYYLGLDSPNSTITNCSSHLFGSPASSLSSLCQCQNCAPHLYQMSPSSAGDSGYTSFSASSSNPNLFG